MKHSGTKILPLLLTLVMLLGLLPGMSLIDGSASYDITEAKNFVMPAMGAVVYVTFKPVG